MMNSRVLKAVDSAVLENGGRLNQEQADKFITFMKDYSSFLTRIDMIKMNSPERMLETLDVNKRSMRKRAENAENKATGEVVTGERKLTAVPAIMPYDVTFDFFEENIEKDNADTTLAQLFARQFANDTVDLAFNGDEAASSTGSDDFLKINNGWIKILTTDSDAHKHDSTTAEATKKDMIKIFDEMLGLMPSQYFQMYQEEDKNLLKIFVSHAENRAYKNQLVERNTALGDSVLINGQNVNYDGFEIVPVGFIPDGVRILTPYKNLAYGIYGDSLRVFHDVKPRFSRHEYTLMASFDFEVNNPDVAVISKKGLS